MNKFNITPFYSKGFENTNSIDIQNKDGVAVVSSRVVADDFGKRHSDVLEKIDELIKTENSVLTMFTASSYKAGTGKRYKEYLMNRDGFSLLVMGFTGKEALQWKLQYIEAFNKMEEYINQVTHNPYANLSPELQMLIKLEQGQTELNQRVGELENNMTIDYSQQETLRLAISTRVYELLGNAKENAKLRSKVYSSLHRFIKKQFSVNSYKNIAVKEFEKARSMITAWIPDEIMMLAIQGAKSQMSLM